MKKLRLLVVLLVLTAFGNALAVTIIKLGSLAPVNSPWDIHLKKMAAEWKKISRGQVQLRIYSGGIMGDEDEMLRKVDLDQLQAAAITGVGVGRIYPKFLTIHVPLLMRTYDECQYVLEQMSVHFNDKIKEKGYRVLTWSVASWVYFFSRDPVISPEDLKKQKLWVWRGNNDEVRTYKKYGFQPIPLGVIDVMPQLQTGGIDAYASDPINTTANQWYTVADNMCGVPWAPMTGAIIISERAWERVPEEYREELMMSARRIGVGLQKDIIKANDEAIATMQKEGLTVNEVPPAAESEWDALVKKAFREFMGSNYDDEIYREVIRHVAEYRKTHGE